MKVVILAGGFGTRISEESQFKPKPMVELGGMPVIWHIMKIYSYYGYNEFIICAGYKQHVIKEYFADYFLHTSDITYDFTGGENKMIVHHSKLEPWRVTIVDTGLNTQTGGRVKRIAPYIGHEPFMLTYGDGLSDVDVRELERYHRSSGKLVTMTAVQPGGKFGALDILPDCTIRSFVEKAKADGGWINGGFMVLEPEVFEMIDGDETVLEREPFERIANMGKLCAYQHDGFWQCMDTMRDKVYLEGLWSGGRAPWKKWE